jgi:HlyD family secretion protein
MKKILLIVLAVVVAAGLVAFMVIKQQSGYTKVLTAKIVRQDLATVVSGTGQIKPKTYANLGATAMGRVTHFYVKEGDRVTKGQTVATIEHVQQEANVAGQKAAIAAAKTDISSYIAAEKTQEANLEKAKADLEQKRLDWERAQGLYTAGILAKQDFDAKKAAYDTDVASVNQAVAALNQSKAQTDSQRGHLGTQVATLRYNQDLFDRTIAVAPFDAIVTNEPVREGETVVEGIQNSEGSTLMTLADMSVVTAEVKVDETDICRCASRQGLQRPRHAGRRSGAAALYRSRHLAVHHRHRRGQGLQGCGYARQSLERSAPRALDHCQNHHGPQGECAFAAYSGADHAQPARRSSQRQGRRSGSI